LVYISIIFLFYFVLLLISKTTRSNEDTTKIIRDLAIESSKKEEII